MKTEENSEITLKVAHGYFRIEELTEAQILNLTDEDIEKMINLALAEEGIKIMNKPVKPIYKKIPEGDVIVFKENSTGLEFTSKLEADKLLTLLTDCKSIVYGEYVPYINNYNKICKRSQRSFSLEKIIMYSVNLFDSIKEDLEFNNKLEKAYSEKLCEYKNNQEKKKAIESRILQIVEDVRNEYNRMQELYSIFVSQYIPMVKDFTSAMYFFKKAYTVNSKTEHFIEDKCNKVKLSYGK